MVAFRQSTFAVTVKEQSLQGASLHQTLLDIPAHGWSESQVVSAVGKWISSLKCYCGWPSCANGTERR